MSDKHAAFFEKYNYCVVCHTLLEENYEFDTCPTCLEQELFKKVREYIRENDVTEYDVAEYFELPVQRVRQWIHEGRIEYQQTADKKILGKRCARCGELVTGGSLCARCINILKKPKGTAKFNSEDVKMRYLEQNSEE